MKNKRRITLRNKPNWAGKKPSILMFSPHIPIKKMYWIFHKGDSDFNPSVPHGHSIDNRYKLELWSGAVYSTSTNKKCGTASRKDMLKLRNYTGFAKFVEECRQEYRMRFPTIHLAPLTNERSSQISRKKSASIRLQNKGKRFINLDGDSISIINNTHLPNRRVRQATTYHNALKKTNRHQRNPHRYYEPVKVISKNCDTSDSFVFEIGIISNWLK